MICAAQNIESKVGSIYSFQDITEQSKDNPYLILFTYKKEVYNKKNRTLIQKIDRIEKSIAQLAAQKKYILTGIRFAKSAADKNLWEQLMQNNPQKDDPTEPLCFIIFEHGTVMNRDGKYAYALGEQGSTKLKEFIDEYLKDEIASTLKQLKEETQQRYAQETDEENAEPQSSTHINVYYPSDPYYYQWGYPWYSYGPGWGYGRWGGYRSHHHRWHGGGHRSYRGGHHR